MSTRQDTWNRFLDLLKKNNRTFEDIKGSTKDSLSALCKRFGFNDELEITDILTSFDEQVSATQSKPKTADSSLLILSPTKKSPDSPLAKFWNALPEAIEDDCTLQLPRGKFLASNTLGPIIFIRKCYRDLLELIIEDWKNGQHTLVLGTPGIGKSTFLCFVLYQLCKEKDATILLQRREERHCLCFKADGTVEEGPFEVLKIYCEEKTTYLLCDGIVPPEIGVRCKILEVSSPRREYWNTFKKRNDVTTRYMPTWSLLELEICWQHCYSKKLNKQLVYSNYKYFGGVVRFVLGKGNQPNDPLKEINEALSRTDLSQALESDGTAGAPEEVSSIILHWKVIDNSTKDTDMDEVELVSYDAYLCDFGSEYIRQQVIDKLGSQLEIYFHNFVEHASGNIYFGQLRGRLFEDLAHKKLQSGGSFSIRNLQDGNIDKLVLEESNLLSIGSIEEIQNAKDGNYLKPIASNFPSVDSIIFPNKLFQMMTGGRHGIALQTLEKILKQLPDAEEIQLFLVTPKNNAARIIKPQPFTKQNRVVSDEDLPDWTEKIQQFVLEIELTKKRKASTQPMDDAPSDEDADMLVIPTSSVTAFMTPSISPTASFTPTPTVTATPAKTETQKKKQKKK